MMGSAGQCWAVPCSVGHSSVGSLVWEYWDLGSAGWCLVVLATVVWVAQCGKTGIWAVLGGVL